MSMPQENACVLIRHCIEASLTSGSLQFIYSFSCFLVHTLSPSILGVCPEYLKSFFSDFSDWLICYLVSVAWEPMCVDDQNMAIACRYTCIYR